MNVSCEKCKQNMVRISKEQDPGTGMTKTRHRCSICDAVVAVFRAGTRKENEHPEEDSFGVRW